MTTLITGASGFVGSAVLRLLLARGEKVRTLVRPTSPRDNLSGLDVEVVVGDLTDRKSLDLALQGCDSLYHVAADYRLWTKDPIDLYRNNVEGTRQIMLAAGEAGVKRIVYTSSVATLGNQANGVPANEETPVEFADMIGDYKRSKYLAEAEVSKLFHEHALPVVIVNPSTPIGPRDIKPTRTGQIILDVITGRMPAYVDTGLNVVHVDDVAQGHLLAYEHGQLGSRYILGGENMTLKEILEMIATITGQAAPRWRLPHNVVLPIAYMSELWARYVDGKEPRATLDGVRMARKHMFFSSAKATAELGYQFRPASLALIDAIHWFTANGYCEKFA